MAIPKLQVLDEDTIIELDREVAEQYFELNGIPKPCFHKTIGADEANAKEEEAIPKVDFDQFLKEGALLDAKGNVIYGGAAGSSLKPSATTDGEEKPASKKVKFSSIDDDHEGNW